jgi:ketosteroid isomerase-like protein
MSSVLAVDDHVAQVRSAYEAINRGDYAIVAELVAPGFEWHPNTGEPDARVLRDRDAMTRVRDVVAVFADFRTDVEQVADLGAFVAVAVCHRGTPVGTTHQVERREAHLWRFAGGRAVSLREYPTLDAALEAAADPGAD